MMFRYKFRVAILTLIAMHLLPKSDLLSQAIGTMQDQFIKLENRIGTSPAGVILKPTFAVKDTSIFSSIPDEYKHQMIRVAYSNTVQRLFERYVNKLINKDEFLRAVGTLSVDTSQLSRKHVAQEMYFFSALDSGKKIVIPDVNRDKNFSNDPIFHFDSVMAGANTHSNLAVVAMEVENYNGKYLEKRKINVRINPYQRVFVGNDAVANRLDLTLEPADFRVGTVRIDSILYNIFVSNSEFGLIDDRSTDIIVLRDSGEDTLHVTERYTSRIGEEVFFGNHVYKVEGFREGGKELHLKYKYYEIDSSRVGSVAARIRRETLEQNEFDSFGLRGNYVLLDFWGTWCGPCVALIPELRGINEEYKEKPFRLVSVAIEKVYNQEKLEKFIDKYQMPWVNLALPFDTEGKELINKFRFQAFPTSILIGPNGNVIYRGSGESAIVDIKHILKDAFR